MTGGTSRLRVLRRDDRNMNGFLWAAIIIGWIVWFSVADAAGRWFLILPGFVIFYGAVRELGKIVRGSASKVSKDE